MRIARTLALALSVVIISSSLPASGAERAAGREGRLRDGSTITTIVKRLVKRFFGITIDEAVGGPPPSPTTTPNP